MSTHTVSDSDDRPRGKPRAELGELTESREVDVIVDDDGSYPTMGTRTAKMDESGQEWVKQFGRYWRYPQQFDI